MRRCEYDFCWFVENVDKMFKRWFYGWNKILNLEIWAKKGIYNQRITRDFCHRKTPEKLWISPKIRIFGEISKEKYLQIT